MTTEQKAALRDFGALLGIDVDFRSIHVRPAGHFESTARLHRTWNALHATAVDTYAGNRRDLGDRADLVMDEAISEQRWMLFELAALGLGVTFDPILYERAAVECKRP